MRCCQRFDRVFQVIKWGTDILQNAQVSETKEFVKSLNKYISDPAQFSQVTLNVKCYRGDQTDPHWMDDDSGIPLL